MAYALLIAGLLLTVAGVRNTHHDLFGLIQGDFAGPNSFIYWLAAIAIIGGAGYVDTLEPLSTAFLALVLIVLVLNQGTGIFDKFRSALDQSATPTPAK
jgi:hypothetical protein